MTESYLPDASRKIVLWGATGAGKSTYLSTLVFYHQQPADERRLCVLPAEAVTAEWVARQVRAMRGDGQEARVQTLEARELRFGLYDLPARAASRFDEAAKKPSRVLGELSVWDVPGATYDAPLPAPLLDAMLDASGIVLLVDPGHRPREGAAAYYTTFFQNTLGALVLRLKTRPGDPRLDDENRLRIPVAICLTKADEHEMLRADESRRVQLREIVGDAAGLLETFLTTHTVIAVSALGRALERRDGREVLVGEPQPWNALRPLRWMLERPPLPRPVVPVDAPPVAGVAAADVHSAPTVEVASAARPEVRA
jgi:GTPase SAR1 family protein